MNAFKFDVGTYPTLVMRSRAHREGRYAGKRSGDHWRTTWPNRSMYPCSMQVKALNRKQRKKAKMTEGEM